MIELRKMNNERFLVNHNQIECIELIPECKVVMMNHDYYLVKDTVEEIIQKIADYNAKVQDIHREISVVDRRGAARPAGESTAGEDNRLRVL